MQISSTASTSLSSLLLCCVVEQKNALCVRRRTYGVCVYPPGRGPFSSLVFLEKSTSNCSGWFVTKNVSLHGKLYIHHGGK